MKKFLIYVGTVILSIAVVLFIFDMLSWYHFGDIPTRVVLIRMIICFCAIEGLLNCIIAFINKRKRIDD